MEVQCVQLAIASALTLYALEEEEMIIIHGLKRKHKYWMKPYLLGRTDTTQRNTFSKLHRDLLSLGIEDEFKQTLRMSPDLYVEVLGKVYPLIYRHDTSFTESIKPEERLDITLRYLALGDCSRTLNQGNLVDYSSVLPIIRDTCAAIFSVLRKEYMATPSTEAEWLEVADGYAQHCQLPHCIGAVDGKHIRVRRPRKSGTLFFNYKKYYSVVLLAAVDSEYRFLYVDVGSEGRVGDSRIWKDSQIYKDICDEANPLHVPPPSKILGIRRPLPYYMVGDDAFALQTNLMKPYPVRDQGDDQIACKYRLSRGRRVVENSFGILATRFRLFLREQDMEPKGVCLVVLAACALHNFLRTRSGHMYLPPGSVDWEDKDRVVHQGEWRADGAMDNMDKGGHDRNAPVTGKTMRDDLCRWFQSRYGKVPWQDRYLEKQRQRQVQALNMDDHTSEMEVD